MARPTLWTRPFVLVTATHLLIALGMMLSVHFPGFVSELGAGEFAIGNVMVIPALVGMLLGPGVGRWLDRGGRRLGLLSGMALAVVVWLLYTTVDALGPWLYLVRAIDGVANVLIYAALFATAADLVPAERRTEGLAIFGSAGLLSIGLAAEVGDVVIAAGGWRGLFLTASVLTGASLLLASRIEATPPAASGVGSAAGRDSGSFWGPFRQADLAPIWFVALVFFVSMGSIFTFMKTFVMALPFAEVGGFFGTYSAVAVGLRLFAGWLPDRVGPARLLAPALGAYGLGLFLLVDVQSLADLVLAGALCGLGHGYTFPILFSLVVTRAHPDARGAATGIFATIDFGGHLVSGPALGFLIERVGYAIAFGAVAALIAATIAGFLLWDRQVAPVPAPSTELEPSL